MPCRAVGLFLTFHGTARYFSLMEVRWREARVSLEQRQIQA
jgi:hypothetical protein